METKVTFLLSLLVILGYNLRESGRNHERLTAAVPQFYHNLTSDPFNTTLSDTAVANRPPNIPFSLRLLIASRTKRPIGHLSFKRPRNVTASTEPPAPGSSAEVGNTLWGQAVDLSKGQKFLFISLVAIVLLLWYYIGHEWTKKLYSATRDKAGAAFAILLRRNRKTKIPALKNSRHRSVVLTEPKPPFWNYATTLGKTVTSRCPRRFQINRGMVGFQQIPQAGGLRERHTFCAVRHRVYRSPC
ncbi:uncharacterized protein LOC111869490 [Cryptotermes secundus]|uniref:uncharacterized protein LOC111869490 n=1 Tax=Cryptotermes secundus TaxID=105785 RepID=UPI001454CA62|nr:uncharacterized protein LOC111869490 [Cryptotermes secundus]XP_033609343.1 uncharacterized protein LOC111869490 [Cryptotermes secundus]